MKSEFMDEHPSGGGRPYLTINERGKKMIKTLAGFMCTDEEIASTLGVTVDTLLNKRNKDTFLECKQNGQATGKASLRRIQFRLAEKSASMAIFLGKNWLGQTDGLSLQERDVEAMKSRATAMKEFSELASPTKKEIKGLFSDEGETNEG